MLNIKYSELREKAKRSFELSLIVNEKVVSVKLAISFAEKEKGLAGVEKLSQNQGMLFCYENPEIVNFWMKGVNLPKLGILFLDAKGKVMGKEIMTNENPTLSCSSKEPIYYALELNPEIVEKVKIGSMIKEF